MSDSNAPTSHPLTKVFNWVTHFDVKICCTDLFMDVHRLKVND